MLMNLKRFQCNAGFITALLMFGSSQKTPCQNQLGPGELPDSPVARYSPMTPHERWSDYLHQNFAQPGAFFQTFFSALGDQTGNVPSTWGSGASEFTKHFGSQFARFTIGGTIRSTAAAALQEDTRYHRCDCRNPLRRAVHAVSRTVLTYDHNGQTTLDIAGLAGLYIGPMIMTTWYPNNYTAFGYGVRQGNIAAAIDTGINLIREFGPDLKRTFTHR
jgi:hypothetical protein